MRRVAAVLLLAGTLVSPAAAEYPDKPVRLIVPQAAGSATDTVARILGAELAKELGQQIIVDNRPGGALTLGLDVTAKSEPDGYTICMGPIGALAITRHMVAKLPYDIERDFQPIALVARGHMLLAVAPDAPFRTVPELIDYAKKNPGKLSNASSSNGSPGHVGGELFKYMSGTEIVHIPYRGGAAAINDLIAGRVQLMFESLNSIASHARSGTVRALAVTGEHRSPGFPDLPTVAEAGVPGYAAPTWSARSSTSSTRRSTARSSRRYFKSGSLRSATNRPAARRKSSPRRSRRIRRNGKRSWCGPGRGSTRVSYNPLNQL
jgi:tripartite-type tricarboxylate transporter receptor subunit TctC